MQLRYDSYNSGIGAKIESGDTSLEELEVNIFLLDTFFISQLFKRFLQLVA